MRLAKCGMGLFLMFSAFICQPQVSVACPDDSTRMGLVSSVNRTFLPLLGMLRPIFREERMMSYKEEPLLPPN
jgi:hypothetical protein